jgi:hypothetical protein
MSGRRRKAEPAFPETWPTKWSGASWPVADMPRGERLTETDLRTVYVAIREGNAPASVFPLGTQADAVGYRIRKLGLALELLRAAGLITFTRGTGWRICT